MTPNAEAPRTRAPGFSGSLRRRLFRDLAVLASLLFGAVLAVTLTLGWRVTNRISASLIENAAMAARKDVDTYFRSVEKSLLIARKWGEAGRLDLRDAASLNAGLIPMLEELPAIGGVSIARADGAGYYLRRDGIAWLSWTRPGDEAPAVKGQWRRWSGPVGLLASWEDGSGYDPRDRPWFQGAPPATEPADAVFWTPPYPFFSLDVPGVTASASWHRPDAGEPRTVIAFDVLLDDVLSLVSGLAPTPNSRAFLFTEQGGVFSPPGRPAGGAGTQASARPYLTPAEETGIPAVSGAVQKWKAEGGARQTPVEYLAQGKLYRAGFRPLAAAGESLWLGVAVPESDLVGQERKSRAVAVLLLALTLGAGIAGSVLLVRKYGRHLRDLPPAVLDRGDMESALLALIRQGEGASLEFKSTLRVNLKTGKPEKGIELAWLKTVAAFMNTDGGRVLFGVDDEGTVVGIDADGFASDDKCRLHFKNLIEEHIGIEHSRALRLELATVQGRKVAVAECERSEKPVYLSQGKEESFYIRSGPSSVKLPVSKVVEYLASRK